MTDQLTLEDVARILDEARTVYTALNGHVAPETSEAIEFAYATVNHVRKLLRNDYFTTKKGA